MSKSVGTDVLRQLNRDNWIDQTLGLTERNLRSLMAQSKNRYRSGEPEHLSLKRTIVRIADWRGQGRRRLRMCDLGFVVAA